MSVDHNFEDSEFKNLSSYPKETTLTINVTADQLRDVRRYFSRSTAQAPTRKAEGGADDDPGKGYDVTFANAKELVFQFKAPDNTVVIDGLQFVNYEIDRAQLRTLALQYGPREAFYALPVIPSDQQLPDGVLRTVFVDAFALFCRWMNGRDRLTRIYVEYCPAPHDRPPAVYGKFSSRGRDLTSLPFFRLESSTTLPADATPWPPLRYRMEQCDDGLTIRGVPSAGDPYGGREERLYWSSGEENLPWSDPIESPFTITYRQHLRRRQAILDYGGGSNIDSQVIRWLGNSLQQRLNIAREHNLLYENDNILSNFDIFIDEEFTHEYIYQRIQAYLETVANVEYPLTHRISNGRRFYLERGTRTDEITT